MKRCLIIFLLIALFVETKAQENTISDKRNKNTDSAQDITNTFAKRFAIDDSLLRGWSVAFNFGITQFRGDIQEGPYKLSSNSSSFNLHLQKKVDDIVSLGIFLSKGTLNGKRYDNSYTNSQTIKDLYDPYDGYAGIGEQFESDFTTGVFMSSINIAQVMIKHNINYLDHKSFSLYYNLGMGVIMFRSLKTNIGSNSYIYGYGYDDPINGNLIGDYYAWEIPEKKTQAKEGIIMYGPTVTYKMSDRLEIDFSSLMTSLTQSDFLDASDMSSQPKKDRFRVISIGLSYSIN